LLDSLLQEIAGTKQWNPQWLSMSRISGG